jgi:hypothetical protein
MAIAIESSRETEAAAERRGGVAGKSDGALARWKFSFIAPSPASQGLGTCTFERVRLAVFGLG